MNSRLANTRDKTIEKVAHLVMWGSRAPVRHAAWLPQCLDDPGKGQGSVPVLSAACGIGTRPDFVGNIHRSSELDRTAGRVRSDHRGKIVNIGQTNARGPPRGAATLHNAGGHGGKSPEKNDS